MTTDDLILDAWTTATAAYRAAFLNTDPQAHVDRRVIVDRRSAESTARWLGEVDKRRNEFRFGRRGDDLYPDPLEQAQHEARQEKARDERDPRDRWSV